MLGPSLTARGPSLKPTWWQEALTPASCPVPSKSMLWYMYSRLHTHAHTHRVNTTENLLLLVISSTKYFYMSSQCFYSFFFDISMDDLWVCFSGDIIIFFYKFYSSHVHYISHKIFHSFYIFTNVFLFSSCLHATFKSPNFIFKWYFYLLEILYTYTMYFDLIHPSLPLFNFPGYINYFPPDLVSSLK